MIYFKELYIAEFQKAKFFGIIYMKNLQSCLASLDFGRKNKQKIKIDGGGARGA